MKKLLLTFLLGSSTFAMANPFVGTWNELDTCDLGGKNTTQYLLDNTFIQVNTQFEEGTKCLGKPLYVSVMQGKYTYTGNTLTETVTSTIMTLFDQSLIDTLNQQSNSIIWSAGVGMQFPNFLDKVETKVEFVEDGKKINFKNLDSGSVYSFVKIK